MDIYNASGSGLTTFTNTGNGSFELSGHISDSFFADDSPGSGGFRPAVPKGRGDGEPKPDWKKYFEDKLEQAKEWAEIRTSSPRNFLRFTFNTIEYVGTTMEVIGFAFGVQSGGATLAYAEFGFAFNTVGVVGNSLIDIYDGRYGSAGLSLVKHYAFHGLGRAINSVSGGVVDEVILNFTSMFYENYVIPKMGDFLGPVETFQRIEYKMNSNYNIIIK